MSAMNNTQHHFLIVIIGAQGQLNPARQLASKLTHTSNSRVTIAIPLYYHRRLFPSTSRIHELSEVEDNGLISHAAYSDGFDEGFIPRADNEVYFMSKVKVNGTETLTKLVNSLSTHGRPATCIIYSFLTAWAADVGVELSLPSIPFWVQPAAVFAILHYYYHGYKDLFVSLRSKPELMLELPGLPRLALRDLPTVLADESAFLDSYEGIFQALERERGRSGGGVKPRVLMNTFHALETDAIEAMEEYNFISIGPMVELETANTANDLFTQDKVDYMEWLDSQEDKSVVYVSFGTFSRFTEMQMKEILKGLKESGKPYLWVVRKDSRESLGETELEGKAGKGMMVEWCNQVRVLSHHSIGCFVTHCGWNSTIESIVCGVPMVAFPQFLDQATNARFVEGVWEVGVRAVVNEEGVMEGKELKECLDVVMREEERGVEIRRKADMWKNKAREAMRVDAFSANKLTTFANSLLP